ncbi:unnamed protein product [Strongylus vulgaris]|uniref:Uncharacterized protein n=1 Tax=Strongylus vulgaris TaxID=40348 RepID=A0A3P7J5A1_STRVU|nr:unnamed protein product [Strongylus vulgaris]
MLLYFWYSIFSSFDTVAPYPFGVRMVNCLNPDIAMAYGIQFLSQYETQGRGNQTFFTKHLGSTFKISIFSYMIEFQRMALNGVQFSLRLARINGLPSGTAS